MYYDATRCDANLLAVGEMERAPKDETMVLVTLGIERFPIQRRLRDGHARWTKMRQ